MKKTSALFLVLAVGTLQAKPELDKVAHGKASVSQYMRTTTYKTGKETILDFKSFNIANGEKVVFQQYNKNARVLSRVIGGSASQINGMLSSNGAVYLLNPAGIFIGKTAIIDTAKFLASTGKLSNQDFLSGNYQFTNLKGLIRNEGLVQADSIAFVAQKIEQLGELVAPSGMVGLFVGGSVYLSEDMSPLSVKFNAVELNDTKDKNTSFAGSSDVYALSLVNKGNITANQIEVQGDLGSKINIGGTLDASSDVDGVKGSICINGAKITLDNPIIDTSALGGGGSVIVGGLPGNPIAEHVFVKGDTHIFADAKDYGEGGKIELLSKDHLKYGGLLSVCGGENSGDGGQITTRAKKFTHENLIKRDVTAPSGAPGHFHILAAGPIDLSTQALWDASGFGTDTGAVSVLAESATPGDQLITFGNGGGAGGLTNADFTMATTVSIATENGSGTTSGVITVNGATITSSSGSLTDMTIATEVINFQGGSSATGQVTAPTNAVVIDVNADTVNLFEDGALTFDGSVAYNDTAGTGDTTTLSIINGTISESSSITIGTGGTVIAPTTLVLQGGTIETTGGSSDLTISATSFVFGDTTNTNASTLQSENDLTISSTTINLAGTLDNTITMMGSGTLEIEQGIGQGGTVPGNYRQSPLIINANGADVAIGTMLSTAGFIDNTIGVGGIPIGDITINDPDDFTVDGPVACKSFTLTGATGTVTFNTRFAGGTEQTVLGGLTTSGNIPFESPITLLSFISDGGDVSIDVSSGTELIFGDLYDIDASGGRDYSSTSNNYYSGGDVTLQGGSSGLTVNGINSLGGSGYGSRSQEQLGGNISLSSASGDMNLQGKIFAASLPIQGASSDDLSNFTGSADVTFSPVSSTTVTYVNNNSFNPTGGLTSSEGSVFVPMISGSNISMPEFVNDIAGGIPTAVMCPTFQTLGSLTFTTAVGTPTSSGIINVDYADTFTASGAIACDAFYQFEGITDTTFDSSITSDGIVTIQNSGDISVQDITITGSSPQPPSTGPANLVLQPSDTFTPSSTQGNLPNGTLQILGTLAIGTGDICLAMNPRTSTTGAGADLSIASIFNDGSSTFTATGNALVLGPEEVLTSFADIDFTFTESITVGDVIAVGDITLDAPTISVTSHTGSPDQILTSTGELEINPTGAHILASGTISTPDGAPKLSGDGELLVQGGLTQITPSILTFVNPMAARFLADDNDFILNFYPGSVPPPPIKHSGGVYHVYDQYDSINGIHFQTYMLEKQNDLYQHSQEMACQEITEFLKTKKDALRGFWNDLQLCKKAKDELLSQAIATYLENHDTFASVSFFYWLKESEAEADAYHMLDAIVSFKEDIKASYLTKLEKSRLQVKVNAAFWPHSISAMQWIELLEIAKRDEQ